MKLPKARTENIVVQNLPGEILIYDLTINKAFCLNDTAAKVFDACDGQATFAELQAKSDLTNEVIYLALDELKKQNLLEDEYLSPFAGMSRREAVKKVGLACAVVLPVVAGLVAPQAAHAASRTGCSPYTGVCIAPNTNVCAGCAGRTIYYTFYQSRNGTCSAGGRGAGFPCPSDGTSAPNATDYIINSTT